MAPLLAAVALGSCEEPESNGVAPGAGASGGGGAGTTSSAPSATTSTASGGSGAIPEWEAAGEVHGCTVERITNAADVVAAHWEPCPDQPDCELFVLNYPWDIGWPADPEATIQYSGTGHVALTPAGVVIALPLLVPSPAYQTYAFEIAAILREDGSVLDAYRVHNWEYDDDCFGGQVALGPTRYGYAVADYHVQGALQQLGGVLAPVDGSTPPMFFSLDETPTGWGPGQEMAMGESRWLWQFYPDALYGLSAIDGSGLATIAKSTDDGPFVVNYPSSTGSTFLFEMVELIDPATAVGGIHVTDGVAPPTPYLVPSDGSYYGRPAFAGSHVGFLRGTGQTGPNTFDAFEVWATVYHADPSQLAPYKVDDYGTFTGMPVGVAGGFGRYAADLGDYAVAVWDLAAKTREVHVMPEGRGAYRPLGITPGHVWMSAVRYNPGGRHQFVVDRIVRFTLR